MLRDMAEVKITSKRQATLPARLCEELGLKPGDRVRVERKVVGGETLWVIRPKRPAWGFFGAASKYARGKQHSLAAVRRSIEKGWRGDRD
jgi:AbrB family looped-hinge helix DNA binding protein